MSLRLGINRYMSYLRRRVGVEFCFLVKVVFRYS